MTALALLERVEALRRSEPAEALAALDAGFTAAARRADAVTRGLLWRTRAHVLRALSRAREAAACYRRAMHWYAEAGDTREQGRCAIGLVDALMYLGRYSEARRAAAAGRQLLERANDRAALARLLNNEGNLWHRLDLPERALACYRAAVRALERAGDPASARMIGTNVGNCLSLLGRCDEARAHYRAAREAHAAAGAESEALTASYNLAYLDFLEHRDEAALAGLAAVRDDALARGIPSLAALARLDRAEIFLRMGAHDEALAEARDASLDCAAIGLRYESAKAGLFAALAQHRLGAAAAAHRGVERALAEFDAEGNQVWTGEALLGLATLWWRDGNPRAAAALLSAARRRFEDAGDRERTACAATLHTRALLACGDVRAARRAFARVARARRTTPRLAHLKLAAGAALAREAGDVAAARRLLARAAAAAERLAARILDEQWRATFWGEWGWPHRELAALELAEGRFAAAFEALEAGRGRALVGATTQRRARGGLPESVRRWAASAHARERTRRAGDSVTSAESTAQLEHTNRVLAARPPRAIRAAELVRALPEGAALLDYFVHDGALGALALTANGVGGRGALASEAQVAQRMHALLFALRGAAYLPAAERVVDDQLHGPLTELAALTLWPLLTGRAVPGALAIAPAGPLARLPWAALPLPDGRALCEAADTVVVPGLRLALARAGREADAHARPLVVAVDAGELDAVARETEAVVAAFPRAQVLAGADATADRFLALAPGAPWIHFAGHGGWRADAPLESGLRLADRWLLAGELAECPLAARWVTLSACHTARALVRPGEEWFGLGRSFLLAGAGAVVAAQWDVDDAATATLMSGLYARLGRGVPIARALSQIQRQLHGAGVHPLDWAAFVALGGPALIGATDG